MRPEPTDGGERPCVVIALGGNALIRRGERADVPTQRRNARDAAVSVAAVARRHTVVVTHGNGPQIGLMALAAEEIAAGEVGGSAPYPLDLLGAATEGMIGYILEQAILEELPGQRIATLLTQTVVDASDPAFGDPTKFIGRVYGQEEARSLEEERGWAMRRDGEGFRRVVPSPLPREILQFGVIERLVRDGVLVVCAGGGGIPVVRRNGAVEGVEAVIDKDRSAALLAECLHADLLMMLTDVPAVCLDWGTPDERPIRQATPEEMRELGFAEGSMGPKVEAACDFVERTGGVAVIGALEEAESLLRGEAGTRIRPAGGGGERGS